MNLSITPAQFASLQTSLNSDNSVKVVETSATTGTLTTKDVTLSYSYDGTDNLEVEVTAKHSLVAKIAPTSAIDAKIVGLFQQYIA